MKRILVPGIAALLGVAVFALPGGTASAADITVPIDTFVDAPIGSLTPLATIPTGSLAGQTCAVKAVGINQESVHENNDLIAASGTSVTMYDVERVPGAVTPASGPILLDDTIVVSVRIGNNDSGNGWGYFSGGMNIEFDCQPASTPPPPTTGPAPTTPPTSPPSSTPPPDSTIPSPTTPGSTIAPPSTVAPAPSTVAPPASTVAPAPTVPGGSVSPSIPPGGLPETL